VQFSVDEHPGLCSICITKHLFDPEAIRAQITNLQADGERIDQAIHALEVALRNIEDLDSHQGELPFDPASQQETTLQDAVKRACSEMVDAITRQRVLTRIERQYPFLKPNSSSVSAALINLAKGDAPMLKLAIPGRGRSPAVYSTEGDQSISLNSDESAGLIDETATRGTGGWQSLWSALQQKYDKTSGHILLTPELRARLYHYLHSYGQGGWQNRAKRVFRREFPHLFVP
jgi:hypothetical protein